MKRFLPILMLLALGALKLRALVKMRIARAIAGKA